MSVIPFTLHNNTLTLCAKQHSNAISVKSDMNTKLTLLIGCTNTLQITFCKETLLHLVPQYAHGGVERLLIVLTMIIVSVNKNSLATIILLPTSAWLCQVSVKTTRAVNTSSPAQHFNLILQLIPAGLGWSLLSIFHCMVID